MNEIGNQIEVPNIERVTDCCFNPDGTLLAFLYIDGSIRIFEADEQRKFHSIFESQPCCRRATSISFASPEHGTIFAFSDDTGKTYLYQRIKINEFKQAMSFHQHKAPINSLAFAPVDLCFATAASDGYVSITSCKKQNWSVQSIKLSDKQATCISWSPPQYMSFIERPNSSAEAKFVVSSADGSFSIFQNHGTSWQQESTPITAHEGPINSIAWRPLPGFTRYEIATCGSDLSVKLWTFEEGEWSSLIIHQFKEEPVSVSWSSCGFFLNVSTSTDTYLYREVSHHSWELLEQ